MKNCKVLFIGFFCWVLAIGLTYAVTYAAEVSFSWLPNQETDLAGYKIHYGYQSGEYATVVDCELPAIVDGRVVFTVEDAPDTLTYYACTAYSTTGETSDYSNELHYNPGMTAPGDFQMTLEGSANIIIRGDANLIVAGTLQ